jgi:signal transduction histidine kinase
MPVVVAMAELLLDSELDAAQRHNTETLVQSARSLQASLTEVVDFAAFESGEAELATERFDLHALVKSAASALQGEGEHEGAHDRSRYGRQLPPLHHWRRGLPAQDEPVPVAEAS